MTKKKTKFLPLAFVICLILAIFSVCFINTSALASDNNSNQASEVHDYSKDNGYMVRIYGINHKDLDKHELGGKADDPDGSVTFGPATGETKDCLSVNKSKEHKHNHGHCLATESWDQIIKHIQEGGAEDYRECLEEGCTHAVELDMNDTIGGMRLDSQCSALFYSIKDLYNGFNAIRPHSPHEPYCERFLYTDYAHSKIHATLNGKTNKESKFTGRWLLDSTNCLLSCFPKILQDNIKAKTFDTTSEWNDEGARTIIKKENITDKLWLASPLEIFGPSKDGCDLHDDYGSRYLYDSDRYKVYSENGQNIDTLLRSPDRLHEGMCVSSIDKSGEYIAWGVDTSTGISPFFCL